MCVDMATAADAAALSAYVVSPSHDESDAIIQQLDHGQHLAASYHLMYSSIYTLHLILISC